jgi:rsbT co-antagonist protein RsbR
MDETPPDSLPAALASFLEDVPVPIIVYDLAGTCRGLNRAAEEFWGLRRADAVNILNLYADATAQVVNIPETLARVSGGERVQREPTRDVAAANTPDARPIWYQATIFPVRDAEGAVRYAGYIYHDVTAQMEQREQLERTQEQNLAQQHLIEELASPVVQVWEGILLAPLVGALDSRRAVIVIEQLLEAIVRQSADVVILDVTGVPLIDTAVASHLVNTARAVRLLGADIALTGMRSELAQAVVQLEIDLSQFVTHADLQSGLAWAFARRELQVLRRA